MPSNWIPSTTVTIANGASLSDAIQTNGASIVAIILPAAWTTADLTLQASKDDSNFFNVYDKDGNDVTIKAAASRYVQINPNDVPVQTDAIKLRSGTSGSPVTQGGDRVIGVVLFGI